MKITFIVTTFGGLFLLIYLVKCIDSGKVYSGHKVLRVIPRTKAQINFLRSLHDLFNNEAVDFWTHSSLRGTPVDIRLPPGQVYRNVTSLLKGHNINFQVQICDLQSAIRIQNWNWRDKLEASSWFEKYHTLQEIFSKLEETTDRYKGRARMLTFGKSYERRKLNAVEITSTLHIPKPLVFINCGIHAREWVSPATCMYIIEQLTSQYPDDITVRQVLNKVDFVVMPVFNVDGYVYSWKKDRMWRKSRSLSPGSSCVGTDLNRNWGFRWGEPGASNHPCSESYHGNSAMSEKEVQAVAKYLESLGRRLVAFMDIHSYSQILMFPWGYTKTKSIDNEELMRVSRAMVDAIKTKGGDNTSYIFGQTSDILYIESGTTKDYLYGHLKVKYTFSMELRDTGRHGFLLPARLIVPTAREAFEGIKALVLNMQLNV
ncbi:carboxypeptidase B-like [Stylophora pistillata]|uniref:carboxypeptidase B-like n=1 Tax=Stylophora pistillata TaxID=50429 RepID=UPI000C03E871|nr:carboxypeptidase B-like [Stylophora pistillata]